MFAGHINHDAFGKLLTSALRRGSATRGNRHIECKGTSYVVETHYGRLVHLADCIIRCKYYASWVFAIDFKRRRLTDFGMADYSISTRETVKAYTATVVSAAAGLIGRDMQYYFQYWTHDPYGDRLRRPRYNYETKLRKKAVHDCFIRYREKMPWMRFEDGAWWFYWDKYDKSLEARFNQTVAFLCTAQTWRYYTFRWIDGVWCASFLDKDAQRRYEARQRRHRRAKIEKINEVA